MAISDGFPPFPSSTIFVGMINDTPICAGNDEDMVWDKLIEFARKNGRKLSNYKIYLDMRDNPDRGEEMIIGHIEVVNFYEA